MGRAAVRSAVATTLTNAAIPYVGSVYPARPSLIEESAYTETLLGQAVAQSPNGSSCVLVVNLPGEDRRLMNALTGRQGVNDFAQYPIVLELFFACTASGGLGAGEDFGVLAQEDYDSIVDALFVTIRSNPVMSAPSSVWSAGEYKPGVRHSQGQPQTSADGETVLITGAVRFEAWEFLSGTGV